MRKTLLITAVPLAVVLLTWLRSPSQEAASEYSAAERSFETNCAACHGAGASGGDRAPALRDNPDLRKLDVTGIANIIRSGTSRGMPSFGSLPEEEVAQLARWIHSMNQSAFTSAPAAQISAGEKFFFGTGGCSQCHMVRGIGNINGPDLSDLAVR